MNIKSQDNNQFTTISEFYIDKKDDLKLKIIAGKKGINNKIFSIDPYRPALALSGYTTHFRHQAIQILGTTEIEYLKTLSPTKRSQNLKTLFEFKIPCIIVSKNQDTPKILKMLCNKHNVPLLISNQDTPVLIHKITLYLMNLLAPYTTLHGTLVDIYGVGVLLTGESGIGKSETALDLIDRGHRLVADDAVRIYRKSEHLLMGSGIAPDSSLQYHMEIRGIGILDIAKIFGIRGVRLHKRIELEVNLIEWKKDMDVERTGLQEDSSNILDVEIPLIKVPLVPGKNISVIIEVIALNHILKLSGYDTAKIFNATLVKLMKEKARKLARLEEDDE